MAIIKIKISFKILNDLSSSLASLNDYLSPSLRVFISLRLWLRLPHQWSLQEESGSRVYTGTWRSAITAITNDALQTRPNVPPMITGRNRSYVIIKEKCSAVVALASTTYQGQHTEERGVSKEERVCRIGDGRGYNMRGVSKKTEGVSKRRCAWLRDEGVYLRYDRVCLW